MAPRSSSADPPAPGRRTLREQARRWSSALAILVLPRRFKPCVLNALGHRVAADARVGWSLVLVDRICLAASSRIGSFNLIACRRVLMRQGSVIQSFNVVRGPLDLRLAPRAAIGRRNIVRRAAPPVTYGPAQLRLGALAKLTAGHSVDCTRSVSFGDYSIAAGRGSQFWTHGYRHDSEGPGRARIDGSIRIGNNVYIGSGCIVSMGVRIADAITVGCLSAVGKSLDCPGLYVSQPLRYLEPRPEPSPALQPLPPGTACEPVFRKPVPEPQEAR